MHLNKYGKIVETEWLKTAALWKNVEVDKHIIMPNHLYSIINITVVAVHNNVPLQKPIFEISQTQSSRRTQRLSRLYQKSNFFINRKGRQPLNGRNYV